MALIKVIEVLAESPNSWEEAAQAAVSKLPSQYAALPRSTLRNSRPRSRMIESPAIGSMRRSLSPLKGADHHAATILYQQYPPTGPSRSWG